MRRSEIIALVSAAALGVGALAFGRFVASGVEETLTLQTRDSLSVLGYPEVSVDVDGMVVEVTGRIRTDRDRDLVVATLESIQGVSSVVDNMVLVEPLVELKPSSLFIQKDGQGVTLSGDAPNAAARDLLAARADLASDGANFVNLMTANDRRASEAWVAASEAAIDAVTALRAGQASVERGVVRVVGAAPDANAKDRISARLQAQIDPTFSLTMEISAPPPLLSPYVFSARKTETRGLEVARCAAPDTALRAVILGELRSRGVRPNDDAAAVELCTIATGAPNEFWVDAVARGIAALDPLIEGEVRIVDDRVSIDGFLGEGGDVAAATAAATANWPSAYTVETFLENELPIVEPFTLTAVKRADEVRLTGHALNRERADAWAALLGAENELALGRGAPPGWEDAVDVVIEALAELPSGAATLSGTDITLAAPGDERDRALLQDRLAAAVPPGVVLRVSEAHVPSPPEGAPDEPAASRTLDKASYSFVAAKSDDGAVAISGVVGDEAAGGAVRVWALAKLGGGAMEAEFIVGDGDPPLGWDRALIAGVDALSLLQNGEVSAEPGAVYLRGAAETDEQIAAATALLEEKTPEEFTRFVEIALAPQEEDEEGPKPIPPLRPAACVAMLNRTVAETPVKFQVGKEVIAPASYPTVNRLVEILKSCPEARIEIGGHTDSVGSDELNLVLSEQRARSVLVNMEHKGGDSSRLEATGYGESRPIADNATTEGQAKNRRIEFRLIE